MSDQTKKPTVAAVIGGGVIGGGWVARLIQNGVDVSLFDPDPEAPRKIAQIMDNADAALARLTRAPAPKRGQLNFASSVADAVADAQLIVEAVPERLEVKQAVYAEIEQAAPATAIISSSTSGIMPTDLQAKMTRPERLMVGHPFNPVYLLPLVEMVAGKQTSDSTIERAREFYSAIGMHPLHVRKEIEAFIADRFLEAVWREALWLIKDGIANTQEIDDAIRFGFGLRWAQMGLFETYRVAGGEAGMAHFIAQFGPCLKWPWTKLMDVPELTDELAKTISDQSDAQSGMHSIRELERIRDKNLVAILQALKANDWGAGKTLLAWEAALYKGAPDTANTDMTQQLETWRQLVPPEWIDANGHMSDARSMDCLSQAADVFTRLCGVDAAYIQAGGNYFTLETHIRHLHEIKAGAEIYITTQVLAAVGKQLHLFHYFYESGGTLLATGEHLLLHVDTDNRSSSLPSAAVASKLAAYAKAHANLALPDGAERVLGVQ